MSEQKIFDNNYMVVLTLVDNPVGHVSVAGADTMQEYLDYFFNQFPIVRYTYNHDKTLKSLNTLTVWGNRPPVETVIELLDNVTISVERLS